MSNRRPKTAHKGKTARRVKTRPKTRKPAPRKPRRPLTVAEQKLRIQKRLARLEYLEELEETGTPKEKEFFKALADQKQERKRKLAKVRNYKSAKAALRKFKPTKKDAGKIVFVDKFGKRITDARNKRKGWALDVNTKGAKKLASTVHRDYKPVPIYAQEIRVTKRNKRKVAAYRQRNVDLSDPDFKKAAKRLLETKKLGDVTDKQIEQTAKRLRRARVKTFKVIPKRGEDFNKSLVDRMAKALATKVNGQASQRKFLISAKAFAKGFRGVLEFQVEISKPDNIKFDWQHFRPFILKAFYAQLARQLMFHGLVTIGSTNHVRRDPDNKGEAKEDWTDSRGETWEANENRPVTLEQIEWRLTQQ